MRRCNLEATLAELLERAPEFAAEIAALVARPGSGTFVQASDAGVAAGGDVTMSAGGDVVGRDKIGYRANERER